MKKILSLLLLLCMILSLCACGDGSVETGSAPADGSSTAPAEDAQTDGADEPEKIYAKRSEEKLVSIEEGGVHDYRLSLFGPFRFSGMKVTGYEYDEFGELAAEKVSFVDTSTNYYISLADSLASGKLVSYDGRAETAEFDDAGNPISVVSYSDKTTDTAFFENGLVIRIEEVYDENQRMKDYKEYEYHPDGSIRKSTTYNYYYQTLYRLYSFENPLVDVLEYNEDGRCTRYHSESVDESRMKLYVMEYRWEYDAAGDPVALTASEGWADNTPIGEVAEPVYRAEMRYDGEHRMISATKTEGDKTTEYSYGYDEEGRLAHISRQSEGKETVSELEYNELGLLVADHRTVNGKKQRDNKYIWKERDNGVWELSNFTGDSGSEIDSSFFRVYPDETDTAGRPDRVYSYAVIPSAATLEPVYANWETEYNYGTVDYLEEIDPETLESLSGGVDAYYPDLNGSYCGVPVPRGDKQPTQVVVEASDYELGLVTNFVYGGDGELLGVESYFDPAAAFSRYSRIGEADEYGRLIRLSPSKDRTVEYTYDSDADLRPDHYTRKDTWSNGSRVDKVNAVKYNPANWIKTPLEELMGRYSEVNLNEDGLLESKGLGSSTGEVYRTTYAYSVDTYDNGAMKAVVAYEDGSDWGFNVMEFDPEGNLTMYYSLAEYVKVFYYYD